MQNYEIADSPYDNHLGSKASICDRYHIDSKDVDMAELAEEISCLLEVDHDIVEDVLSWEVELQDRQYLCERNYADWLSEEVSQESGIERGLVYDILEAESDLFFDYY